MNNVQPFELNADALSIIARNLFNSHQASQASKRCVWRPSKEQPIDLYIYFSLSVHTHTKPVISTDSHACHSLPMASPSPVPRQKHTSGIQELHEGAADGFCGHHLPPPSAAKVFVFMGRAGWPLHNKGVQIWTRAHIGCESAPIICTICSPAII